MNNTVRTTSPPDWDCPFCRVARGGEGLGPWTKRSDVVYRDPDLTAFLSAHFWQNNPGHVVIIPNRHYENLYEMPDGLLGKVAALSKRVAIAMKRTYGCDGTSIRQHNEPAGGQDVWHYHLHVFSVPRRQPLSLLRGADDPGTTPTLRGSTADSPQRWRLERRTASKQGALHGWHPRPFRIRL
jgi:histidine triad (HIT) family protein